MHTTVVILNEGSGTLASDPGLSERLRAIVGDRGEMIRSDKAGIVDAIVGMRQRSDLTRLIVGGGDGTLSFAASTFAGLPVVLGLVPLGTMNLFARGLDLPLEPEVALEAALTAPGSAVDLARINGRVFTHHVTLGLHPQLIENRNARGYGGRIEKVLASVQAAVETTLDATLYDATISSDGDKLEGRFSIVAFTNNVLAEGALPAAETLTGGRVGLYVSEADDASSIATLMLDAVRGRFRASDQMILRTAANWTLDVKGETHPTVSIDGEIVQLRSPFHIESLPRAITIAKGAGGDQ